MLLLRSEVTMLPQREGLLLRRSRVGDGVEASPIDELNSRRRRRQVTVSL